MSKTKCLLFLGEQCDKVILEVLLESVQLAQNRGFEFTVLLGQEDEFVTKFFSERFISVEILKMPHFKRQEYLRTNQKLKYVLKVKPLVTDLFCLSKYLKKLFRFFSMHDFELVHTVGMRSHFLSLFLKLRFDCELIWQAWDVDRQSYALLKVLGSIFLPKIHFHSNQQKQPIVSLYQHDKDKAA